MPHSKTSLFFALEHAYLHFDQKCIMFFLIPSQNAKILTPGSKKVPHWVCEIFDEKMAFLIFMMRYRQTAFFEKFAKFSGYSIGGHFRPIQKPHFFFAFRQLIPPRISRGLKLDPAYLRVLNVCKIKDFYHF